MEFEIIRRFLIFPLIFSLFLFHTQLFQVLVSQLVFQLSVVRWQHDTYIVNRPFSALETLAPFLPRILIGLFVGLCFAALDYQIHQQKDRDGWQGIRSLLRNLFNSGALVWLAIAIFMFVLSVLRGMWSMNNRFHAYPPEMQFFEKVDVLPPFFIALALLWAMVKTLRRDTPRKFSALSE